MAEMSTGPCVAMEIREEGGKVTGNFREFCGPHDPDLARSLRPNTLRALFGKDKVTKEERGEKRRAGRGGSIGEQGRGEERRGGKRRGGGGGEGRGEEGRGAERRGGEGRGGEGRGEERRGEEGRGGGEEGQRREKGDGRARGEGARM